MDFSNVFRYQEILLYIYIYIDILIYWYIEIYLSGFHRYALRGNKSHGAPRRRLPAAWSRRWRRWIHRTVAVSTCASRALHVRFAWSGVLWVPNSTVKSTVKWKIYNIYYIYIYLYIYIHLTVYDWTGCWCCRGLWRQIPLRSPFFAVTGPVAHCLGFRRGSLMGLMCLIPTMYYNVLWLLMAFCKKSLESLHRSIPKWKHHEASTFFKMTDMAGSIAIWNWTRQRQTRGSNMRSWWMRSPGRCPGMRIQCTHGIHRFLQNWQLKYVEVPNFPWLTHARSSKLISQSN